MLKDWSFRGYVVDKVFGESNVYVRKDKDWDVYLKMTFMSINL